MTGLLKLVKDVTSREQESSFANSTLTSLNNRMAVSIAVSPPAEATLTDITEGLSALAQAGWNVEIQIGPDEEKDGDDD